jgi:hypothetical protein
MEAIVKGELLVELEELDFSRTKSLHGCQPNASRADTTLLMKYNNEYVLSRICQVQLGP